MSLVTHCIYEDWRYIALNPFTHHTSVWLSEKLVNGNLRYMIIKSLWCQSYKFWAPRGSCTINNKQCEVIVRQTFTYLHSIAGHLAISIKERGKWSPGIFNPNIFGIHKTSLWASLLDFPAGYRIYLPKGRVVLDALQVHRCAHWGSTGLCSTGPTLVLLYINDCINDLSCGAVMFADDARQSATAHTVLPYSFVHFLVIYIFCKNRLLNRV